MDPVSAGMTALKVAGGVKKGIDIAVPIAKKVIEVSIPVVKQASLFTLKFIEGGIVATTGTQFTLNKPVKLVSDGLSLPINFHDNQLKPFTRSYSIDLNIIKGQNDMVFLSNSVSYFISSHSSITGIDRSLSHALQYDIEAVRQHLKQNREIRFPGYLLHQCKSLAETIKELNLFYLSILENGEVPNFNKFTVEKELNQNYGNPPRPGRLTSYMPFDLQLPVLKIMADKLRKDKSFLDIFGRTNPQIFGICLEEINDEAHAALFILSEELIANEELEDKIAKKLKALPEKRLFVKLHSVEPDAVETNIPSKKRSKKVTS